MIHSSTNLNQLAFWVEVLTTLKIHVPVEALPCVVQCPSCGANQLNIYQDTTDTGQWHYCSGCEISGDMIQLAARAWNLDIQSAVDRLGDDIAALRHHNTAAYEKYWLARQKNASFFLTTNANNILQSQELRHLKLRLDGQPVARSETWKNQLSRYFVSGTRDEIDAMVDRPTHSPFKGYRWNNKNWKEVIAIPYYDMPGRISAFLLCHGETADPTPFVYRTVCPPRLHSPTQHGIAFFDALSRASPEFGNDLFVFMDPVLALRTHLQYTQDYSRVLPIVSVHEAAKPSAYLRESRLSHDIIFWGTAPTPQLFKHAQASAGKVTWYKPADSTTNFMRYKTTSQWMSILRRESYTWDTALETHLATLSSMEMASFMLRLEFPDEVLYKFIATCSPDMQTRLHEVCGLERHRRRVTVNNHQIAETERGWQLVRNNEVLSDVVFKLNRVIHYPDNHYYEGEATCQSKTLPFMAPGPAFDNKPLEWLRKLFIHNGGPIPVFSRTWQQYAMAISQRLQQPKSVAGLVRCGWDDATNSINTVDYSISSGGRVVKHGLPSPDRLRSVQLPRPQLLTHAEVLKLSEHGPEQQILWAVGACVLYNVLAPLYRYERQGVLITGAGIDNVARLATAMGCPENRADLTSFQGPDLGELEDDLRWPMIFVNQLPAGGKVQLWIRRSQHNCLMYATWLAAHVYAIDHRWLYLDAHHTALNADILKLAGKVVAGFLQALAENKFVPWVQNNPGSIRHIFENLMCWFEDQGGKTDIIEQANDIVRFDEDGYTAAMFFEIVAYMRSEGHLRAMRAECVSDLKGAATLLYLSAPYEGTWIPKMGMDHLISRRFRGPSLDKTAVTNALIADNLLLDEVEVFNQPGWVVPTKALELSIKRWSLARNRLIGVVK